MYALCNQKQGMHKASPRPCAAPARRFVTLLYPRTAMTALQLFGLQKLDNCWYLQVDYSIMVRGRFGVNDAIPRQNRVRPCNSMDKGWYLEVGYSIMVRGSIHGFTAVRVKIGSMRGCNSSSG